MLGYYAATGLKDPTIADWFREGRDLYTEIAARAFKKSPEAITKEERQRGKLFYLMIMFGAGPRKIAHEIDISEAEAKKFYIAFHEGFPQVKRLSNPAPPGGSRAWDFYTPGLIEAIYKRRGFLKTPWGRHIHAEKYGEFKLLNRVIQGSAADYMKAALRRVARWQRERGVEGRMVLTVHDSILADIPRDELEVWAAELPPLMIAPDDIAVAINEVIPIEVSVEASTTSWADKAELEEVVT